MSVGGIVNIAMKITVVTPFDSANYGAYLQAYCLKHQLEVWGHEVNHVLTRDKDYVRRLYYTDFPKTKGDKLMPWRFSKKKRYGIEKYRLFLEDQKVFNVTNHPSDELCILGSDEIWNIKQPAFRKDIFWGKGMPSVISYATSIGGAVLESFEKYPELINAIRKLDIALVRDQRTKEFVKKYSPDGNVDVVCDPTMLIPVDAYGKSYDDTYLKEHDCLLVYAYSLRDNEIKTIRQYARHHGLKTVSCCFYHSWCDHQCMGGPLQFSSMIRQCKAVVTTTFHGSIFSILNQANFVSIPASPKTNQLLAQLGLSGRLVERERFTEDTIMSVLNERIDYQDVKRQIEEIRAASLEKLQQAINMSAGKQTFDYQICPSDDCTGCFACMNKCQKQAISIVTDRYGRTLPMIDPVSCIRCGLCKSVCPSINPVVLQEPKVCYAAQRPDATDRKQSSSGGVGAILAEEYIRRGGIVYGAAVGKDTVVRHQRADTMAGIEAFRCSKYVQSLINDTYRETLTDLKSGKEVLFTGTPCQIAGLRSFLEKDYPNLCLVDIICHGVPPMKYLAEYIHRTVPNRTIDYYSFRGGERDFVLRMFSGKDLVYERFKGEDAYFTAFLNRLVFRENCYRCQYAVNKRVGDITIGDFWKLNRDTLVTPQTDKISAVMINTEKGDEAFRWVQAKLISEPRTYEEAIQGNPQLREPSIKHKDRDRFTNTYEKNGDFMKSIEHTSIGHEINKYKKSKSLLHRGVKKIKCIIKP